MKHFWWAVAALLAAGVASGQPNQQLPRFGEYLNNSGKNRITDKCPLGYSFDLRDLVCVRNTISISRAPGEFSLATTAALSCATSACILTFPFDQNKVAYADWIMPSFALDAAHILLSWRSAGGSGSVRWQIESCRYAAGALACTPTSTLVAVTAQGVVNTRIDTAVALGSPWGPNDHVVLGIRRAGYDPATGDTLNGDVALEGFRLEFVK